MVNRLSKWVVMLAVIAAATLSFASDKSQTATGCLRQGKESQGFFLVTSDNHHWELYPANGVSLSPYVGQTVTVTGSAAHRTEAQEQKSQPYEKQEISGAGHGDLEVSNVKVVSKTCK